MPAAFALVALAFTGCATLTAPYPSEFHQGRAASVAPLADLEFYVLAEVQRVRRQHRQPTWRTDRRLARAARQHSEDMALRRYFAHVNGEGWRAGDRARAAGYTYQQVAENLFWGTATRRDAPTLAADAVQAWLESPDHRDVLLDPALADVGVGVSRTGERLLVTLIAGQRRVNS